MSGDTPKMGDNSISRYEQVKEKLARLEVIRDEIKVLSDEASGIKDSLEKESGINRGALAATRKLARLEPAAITAYMESRSELEDWLVNPLLDEAAANRKDEE